MKWKFLFLSSRQKKGRSSSSNNNSSSSSSRICPFKVGHSLPLHSWLGLVLSVCQGGEEEKGGGGGETGGGKGRRRRNRTVVGMGKLPVAMQTDRQNAVGRKGTYRTADSAYLIRLPNQQRTLFNKLPPELRCRNFNKHRVLSTKNITPTEVPFCTPPVGGWLGITSTSFATGRHSCVETQHNIFL